MGRDPNCCCEIENVLLLRPPSSTSPSGPPRPSAVLLDAAADEHVAMDTSGRPSAFASVCFMRRTCVFLSCSTCTWLELTHWTRAARHHSDFFLLVVDPERKTSVEQSHVQTAAHTCECEVRESEVTNSVIKELNNDFII